MRIRGGSAKGREIVAPKGTDTRPTADKVKEAMFNVIAVKISEAVTLDLCAGSGNLGLEAISRGASHSFFVDNNLHANNAITRNTTQLGFNDQCTVLKMEALKALEFLHKNAQNFNIIFFDPPYQAKLYEPVLDFLSLHKDILRENGVVVVECSSKDIFKPDYNGLILKKESKYGDTKVLYYQF